MAYGNLAYDLPEREDTPKRRKPQKNRVKTVKRNREQMLVRSKNIRRICIIIAIAMSASFMISQFVTVYENNQRIAALEKELAKIEAETSQMVFDMEQSIDLAEIEKQATTRLGMQRPEKYQTIYVNVRQDDVTEKTAGEVENVAHSISSAAEKISGNIVNAFSIK